MASISNLSIIHQSRSSSFHKLHCTSHRNVHPISNHLEFSPLHKKIASLKTPTLLKLSHRLSDFRLVKAAAADAEGHEIELAKGLEQICSTIANMCCFTDIVSILAGLSSLTRVFQRNFQLL